jgi:hypothetical protein
VWYAIHVARVVEASKPDLAAGRDRALCSAPVTGNKIRYALKRCRNSLGKRQIHLPVKSEKCSGAQNTAPKVKWLFAMPRFAGASSSTYQKRLNIDCRRILVRASAPDTEEDMSETPHALILDLLEWLAKGPKPYADVMDAWRTSCPRLSIWEDATEQGLIRRRRNAGEGPLVELTDAGWAALHRNRPVERSEKGSGAEQGRPRG